MSFFYADFRELVCLPPRWDRVPWPLGVQTWPVPGGRKVSRSRPPSGQKVRVTLLFHFFLLHWYYFEIWLCRVFIYKYFQICVFYILVLLDLASGGGGVWVSKWLESECSCTPRVSCRNLRSTSQKIRHFRHMTQERYFRSPLWFYRHLCSIVLLSVERECSRSQSTETGCEWKLLVMYNTWLVFCFYLLEIWCYLLKSRK